MVQSCQECGVLLCCCSPCASCVQPAQLHACSARLHCVPQKAAGQCMASHRTNLGEDLTAGEDALPPSLGLRLLLRLARHLRLALLPR